MGQKNMTNAVEISAIERLKAAGTSVDHCWDEEGVVDTTETQLQLAPGILLRYFDADESSSISIQECPCELDFFMNEQLADMFLRLDSLSAAEMFAELGRARI